MASPLPKAILSTRSLSQSGRQVLGVDLNCSESGIAETQGDWWMIFHLAPEVLERVRCQLGVTHRVLNVSVPEPSLQRPGVVAGVGQGIAAAVPQHMRVDWERHFRPLSDPAQWRMECFGRRTERKAPCS